MGLCSCSGIPTLSAAKTTIYAHESNVTGHGYFIGNEGSRGTGDAMLQLGETDYKGTWVMLPKGTTSWGLLATQSTHGRAVTGGLGAQTDLSVPGQATMVSDEGDILRCEFLGSRRTRAAAGICADRQDLRYDIQIVFGPDITREEADRLRAAPAGTM